MKRHYFQSRQPAKNKGQLEKLKNYAVQQIKKALLVLLIAGNTLPAFSQWSILSSGVTNTLRSPYFTSETVGYVVGEPLAPAEAIILKTTDGGTTWTPKTSGTLNALRGVHFTDANTGFAVGFVGTILKTTNAGETWTAVTSGTTQALRSVSFPSNDIGYIAGSAGTMLKTTNGGATWTPQTTGITADLINVRFASNDVGYAVSSSSVFADGAIIKTVNGGTTWTSVYTNTQGLLGLAVIDANNAYAGGGNNQGVGGNSYIVKTTDGGATWSEVYTGLANAALRGAWFTTPNKGWFVGDFGEMPSTNNGGGSWQNDSIQFNGLLGIHFPGANVGYAVGAGGTILKYNTVIDCPKPSNLSVGNITSNSAVVQWDVVTGAIGYKVYYHAVGDPVQIKKPSPSNSKKLVNLQPSTTYKWAAQSVCSDFPAVTSSKVSGPDFTTAPLRLSEASYVSLDMEIFPNPASESAAISFSLNDESPVLIRVMDMNGKVIQEIDKGTYPQGSNLVSLNSSQISSGLYLLQLTTNEEVVTKKLMIER